MNNSEEEQSIFEEFRPQLFEYAEFGHRLMASLIDYGIVTAAAIIIAIAPTVTIGIQTKNPEMTGAFYVFALLFASLTFSWLYQATTEASPMRGTIGKWLMNLELQTDAGGEVGFWKATARYFIHILVGLVVGILSYITVFVTDKKQCIHDLATGTVVIRKKQRVDVPLPIGMLLILVAVLMLVFSILAVLLGSFLYTISPELFR